MAEDNETPRIEPGRDVGQGDRDIDPRMRQARKRADETGGSGIPDRTDMPDFTSGPGYTGQVPPEGGTEDEGNWNAGSDRGRG